MLIQVLSLSIFSFFIHKLKAEGLDLVADLVEASRDGKSELSVPIPSLIAKSKLLMADACMKLKQYQNALQKVCLSA